MESLIDRIKELMNANGIKSLAQLEKECGLVSHTVNKWNTNTPSIDKVEKVARYFDVSLDYLLGVTDIKKPAEHYTQQELDLLDFILSDPELLDYAVRLQSRRTHQPSPLPATNETKK